MPKAAKSRIQSRTWAKQGIKIYNIKGELPRSDRETAIEFYETSKRK